MEKRGVVVLTLAGLICAGTLVYFFTSTPGLGDRISFAVSNALSFAHIKNTSHQTTVAGGVRTSKDILGSGSFADIFALGGYHACTVSAPVSGGVTSGTVYLSKGKFRADFMTAVQNSLVTYTIISDGKTVFAWTKGSGKGVKFPSTQSATTTNALALSAGIDLETQAAYSCSTQIPDSALFVPPRAIIFTNLTPTN